MLEDRNPGRLRRYYEAFNARDLSALDDLLADDVVTNVTEELGLGQGREAFTTYWQTAFAAMPDARQQVLDVVAERDWVAVRYLGTGTQQGELAGLLRQGTRPAAVRVANSTGAARARRRKQVRRPSPRPPSLMRLCLEQPDDGSAPARR